MNITPKPLPPPADVTDAELRHEDELAWLGVASCSTCGTCRAVAEMRLTRHARVRDARRAQAGERAARAIADIDACAELDRLAAGARAEC